MSKINKEAYKECKIVIIDDKENFWINRRDLEIASDYKYWAQIFDKCDPEKEIYRSELIPNTQLQSCRKFVPNDLAERKIKIRIVSSKKNLEFKEKLGLDAKKYVLGEQDIVSALQIPFECEILHTRYRIQKKRIDLYFSEPKHGIEIDQYGHVKKILKMNYVDK